MQIKSFFNDYKDHHYKKGQVILRSEDVPQGVYYLKKGSIRVFIVTEDGLELTINLLHPSSFFPMSWAILNTPNNYFFEAMTDVETSRAPLQDFLDFIHKDVKSISEINKIILYSLNRALLRLQYMVLGNARERVANVLLMLGGRMGTKKKNGKAVAFPITQQQIANLAALTRESVGYELKQLAKEKLISRKYRNCTINNTKLLQEKYCSYSEGHPLPFIC